MDESLGGTTSRIVISTRNAQDLMTPPTRLPTSFYVRLSAACFVLGAGMEVFMYYTGFYNV